MKNSQKTSIRKKSLKNKLLLWILAITLIPLLMGGVINYHYSSKALKNSAHNFLKQSVTLTALEVESFFSKKLKEIHLQSGDDATSTMLENFIDAFHQSALSLEAFVKSPAWINIYRQQSKNLKHFTDYFEYYDTFLIDKNGNILFTLAAEDDLGTNLFTGKYSNTQFAEMCKEVLKSGQTAFSNFELYAPSSDYASGFIADVLLSEQGKKIGLIAFKFHVTELDKIIKRPNPIYSTYDTYLIAKERQTQHWHKKPISGKKMSNVPAVTSTYIGRKGYKVIGLHENLDIPGIKISIMSEISSKEIFTPVIKLKNIAILVSFLTILIVFLAAYFISKGLLRPITKLKNVMEKIATGKINTQIDISEENEIGQLASSFVRIITDLNVSREEIITARDYTHNIIKSITDTLIVISPNGLIKTVNQATLDLLGYNEDELIGKDVSLIFEEKEEEGEEGDILNEINDPAILISKDFNILKANTSFIETQHFNLKDIIGRSCYKVTHNRDDICQAPHDICPIREKFTIKEAHVEMHTHFDLQGNKHFVNVVAAPIFNKFDELLYYLHISSEMKNEDSKEENELIEELKEYAGRIAKKIQQNHCFTEIGLKKLFKKGSLQNYELNYKNVSGKKIPMNFSGSLMNDKDGNLIGIVGISRDMREIKRLLRHKADIKAAREKAQELTLLNETLMINEKQLKASNKLLIERSEDLLEAKDKAEKLAKAKSEFLSNMSHEIRTPMNAILGFSELLDRTFLDSKQKNYLNTVSKNGELLLSIINDILDFSKIESGKILLENIDFDLQHLIYDVLRMLSFGVKESPFDTYIDIDENIPINIKGDPSRLRQVLLNLVGNAIKFTKKGEIGVIVCEEDKASHLRSYRSSQQKNKNEISLKITVKDTGIGIPAEKQKNLFDAFTQADSSITREYGGTGLGLAISKSLIETMGGRIWVQSEVGHGSEFIFTLPFTLVQKDIPYAIKQCLKGKKVLIVDDNEIARKILKKYCHNLGMNIVCIEDSAESILQKIEELVDKGNKPDLLLFDIMMEKMNGYEMVNILKKNEKHRMIKTIAITSDPNIETSKEIVEEIVDGYLIKPIISIDLAKVIFEAFNDDACKKQKCKGILSDEAETVDYGHLNILFVEDNVPNQILIQTYLDELGCRGTHASSGKDAVEKLKKKDHRYNLILMDLQMPILNGFEATKIIREEIDQEIPIIALTASVQRDMHEKAISYGMNDFTGKPITFKTLKEILLKWGKNKTQTISDEKRILIVDDLALNRVLIKNILSTAGHKIVGEAKNFKECVDFVKSNQKIDIIALDLMMPREDNLNVHKTMEIIKNLNADIKILIISAVADNMKKFLINNKINADGFVNKPFERKELLLKVKNILK